ncbi:helix-turn-helix transcriptional regulator [uncultured Pseudokineococcus sp.]|uniref:ArsR/SmtB family transcription factor n=1 Tax=uncultured Pseudokineococcus sp. TaxID=1642928 RepID=UPI002604B605|nr:metalloregulator ArsR/SmtB family transcription factor [uncultured Pseudokineococcus sp.]
MSTTTAPAPARDVAGCCRTPVTAAPLPAAAAGELARTLKALADPARLRLLSLIASTDEAEACVCDLTEPVGLSQPTVSHHLKTLVDAGLLTRERRGSWAFYALVPGALDAVADALRSSGGSGPRR